MSETIGSFEHAIDALREYRWQHATNDEGLMRLIEIAALAHSREMGCGSVTGPLREWAHGDSFMCDAIPSRVDEFCAEIDAIVAALKARLGDCFNQVCDEQDAYLRVASERDQLTHALVTMFKDYRKATKKVMDPTFEDMTCYWLEELDSFGIEVD